MFSLIGIINIVLAFFGFSFRLKEAKQEQTTQEELRRAETTISIEKGKKERRDEFKSAVDKNWDILNED